MSQPDDTYPTATSCPHTVPLIAVVGPANSGKTTLICRLLTLATTQGWRVGVVKHTHKAIDPEPPGKDSRRFREAGAQSVALAAAGLLQVIHRRRDDPPLAEVLAALEHDLDLILVEGYKHSDLPKLVFVTPDAPPLTGLRHILAYISDIPVATTLPVFPRDAVPAIFGFLRSWLSR
ncbi:MAG: molybdopterin-guanine dinucleotide biosynthesis protein B [Desulfobacca sp.]|uniref:molybdopterin-guanine dinucleotide biosynthesis protein B n=1 Tax=Desulfobacca sp. TaxID=2067990 RepID=UPI004049779D